MFIVYFGGNVGVGVSLAVVVIGNNGNFGYSSSFRKLDVGFGRATHFLTPSRVESIDKTSILSL